MALRYTSFKVTGICVRVHKTYLCTTTFQQDPLHSRPFLLSFLVKDNSHSYTHLKLALGIVREPTVWGLLLQHISLTRNESQKHREWRRSYVLFQPCGGLGVRERGRLRGPERAEVQRVRQPRQTWNLGLLPQAPGRPMSSMQNIIVK